MDYTQLKAALVNEWNKLNSWESQVRRLPQTQMIETLNCMNLNLNNKHSSPDNISNALARQGYVYMREIERLQKINPQMADTIHSEVHYPR